MATERQIEANRRNASRSSGPRTESGKARSRLNAVKHGMAGESAEVEAMASDEFSLRRAKWGAEFEPVGETAEWALDRAVAASLRIERCERAVDQILDASGERAELAWDQDRAVEAAKVFNRLGRDPVLASRQLETTFAGVMLLIDAWYGLAEGLKANGDWSESEVSKALDLLGVSPEIRRGRTAVDDPAGGDAGDFRRLLTAREILRLETLRDQSLAPLEDLEQRQAMAGDVALLSKPAKLVLRYEREAWRRYRESMAQVREQATAEVEAEAAVVEMPASRVEVPPVRKVEPRETADAESDSGRSFEEERRELQAMAAPLLEMFAGRLGDLELGDEPDWFLDLERRLDGDGPIGNPAQGPVTERTRFPGRPLDPARTEG